MGKLVFAGALIVLSVVAYGKDLKRILRAIEKGDLERTLDLITRSISDEPTNPGAKYLLAKHLSFDSLSIYDIDTARLVVNDALNDYGNADYEVLEELSKNGIGLTDIETLANVIEEKHFKRAITQMTPNLFEDFLRHYPLSSYEGTIVRARDSLLWSVIRPTFNALQYKEFLNQYSRSHLVSVVQSAYDSLLYFDLVGSNQLSAYKDFIRRHPNSPYRGQVESVIFERSTAANDLVSFQDFLTIAENTALIKKTHDVLYYLDPEYDLADHPAVDSLEKVAMVGNDPLVPIFSEGIYQFLRVDGEMVNGIKFDEIPAKYKCGGTIEDVLLGKKDDWLLFNRVGTVITKGDFQVIQDLGKGMLFLSSDENGRVVHKSGYTLIDNVDEAALVGKRWIKARRNGKYGLIAFSGYPITSFKYNEILTAGDFWIFQKGDDIAVYNTDRILAQLEEGLLELDYRFDDFEVINDSLLIGFRGDRECLLDRNLNFLIPWGSYEIYPGTAFHYTRTDSVYQLYGDLKLKGQSPRTRTLRESKSWLALKTDSSAWVLINKMDRTDVRFGLDSVYLVGDFLSIVDHESDRFVLLPNKKEISLSRSAAINLLPIFDRRRSSPYFVISDSYRKDVMDTNGDLLFSGSYSQIRELNDSLFVVTRNNRSGILRKNGEVLLNLYYDAVDETENLIFLLRRGKIGAYDLRSKKFIDPRYEAKLTRFGESYITKYQGKYGIIDGDEKSVLRFAFDDIKALNDSVVWVRSEGKWSLNNPSSGQVYIQDVLNFRRMVAADSSYYLIYKSTGYGLVNSNAELIVPPKFNEIKNLGTLGDPMFQVELFSPEADFYLLIYINHKGDRLFSEAYRPDEYDMILCDD